MLYLDSSCSIQSTEAILLAHELLLLLPGQNAGILSLLPSQKAGVARWVQVPNRIPATLCLNYTTL